MTLEPQLGAGYFLCPLGLGEASWHLLDTTIPFFLLFQQVSAGTRGPASHSDQCLGVKPSSSFQPRV